jgi:diaminopimelate epimerase
MGIETPAGIVRAEVMGDQVRLIMTEPHGWRWDQALEAEGDTVRYHFVNTGVPHVVVEVEDLAAVDVARLGAAIRYHAAFAPKGTNANFMQVDAGGVLRVRTYERGVEAETLACGTGMVACGLVAGLRGRVQAPVTVMPASGDRLEVDFRATGDGGATRVTLLGPAVHVFRGTLHYSG